MIAVSLMDGVLTAAGSLAVIGGLVAYLESQTADAKDARRERRALRSMGRIDVWGRL